MAVRLLVRHPRSAAGDAGEISFEFEQARIVIGRSPGADVRLPGLSVSEIHATIAQQHGHYALQDEGTTNGTRVNDAPLVAHRPRALVDGDEIGIAEFTLRFSEGALHHGPTAPERTASLARRMLRELMGDDSAASQPPFLRVAAGPEVGTLINLGEPGSQFVIGRGEQADLMLQHVDVSRAHVVLVRDLDGTLARDLGSKNGLEVNGRRVRERRLRHGDVIRVGDSAIVYQDLAEQALRDLEHQPDQTETRTQPSASPSAEPEAPPPEEQPAEEPATAPEPETPPLVALDYAAYGLALFVLVASILGLIWLFK
jgi:pSer/pThr/pTyr-binding forkhead associated (FHA) protein